MKITICSSLHFAKEIIEAKNELENMGHTVLIPSSTQTALTNPEVNTDLEFCFKNNVQKKHFNFINESDAVLILNHEKNGIKGYIGGATLMEMAVAQHLDKKIFLLNQWPKIEDLKYSTEIQLTKPTILNGDLTKII